MRCPHPPRTPVVGALALALLLLGAVDAGAQRRPPPTRTPTSAPTRTPAPQVRGASPNVQRLSRGGAHKLITITGSHLERLTGGRIERPDGRRLNARVTLPGRRVPPGGLGRRVVRVQATDRTGTGNDLRLVLTTPRDQLGRVTEVTVPLRLVVLDAVRIDRARATSELRAGGEAVRFAIAGRGLWQLHHPRLERNGRTVPGTSVEFAERTGRRVTLVLRVGPDVAPGRADVVAGTIDRPMTIGPVTVVAPTPPPSLASLAMKEGSLPPGGRTEGRVELDRAAEEETTVALETTGPVTAPAGVRIPAGRRDATFFVEALEVDRATRATVTARLADVVRSAEVVVEAPIAVAEPEPAPEPLVSKRLSVGRLEVTLASPTGELVPRQVAVGRLEVTLKSPTDELVPKRITVGRLEVTLESP